MGSSVVQHGWQNYGWSSYGGGIREVPAFAVPWNLSRRALVRPARAGGAVRGRGRRHRHRDDDQGFLGDPGNVEFAVFGTAVRETTLTPRGRSGPRMCALSGQDVDKLRRIGAETLGCHRPHVRRLRRAQHAGQPDDGLLVGQPGDDRAHAGRVRGASPRDGARYAVRPASSVRTTWSSRRSRTTSTTTSTRARAIGSTSSSSRCTCWALRFVSARTNRIRPRSECRSCRSTSAVIHPPFQESI